MFIAANGTGEVAVYDDSLHVPAGFPLATPMMAPLTGIVVNDTTGFSITGDRGTAPAQLLTATEDGKIFASSPQATSEPMVFLDQSTAGASFKGLALVDGTTGPVLLVADFAHGRVTQVDANAKTITSAATTFADPQLPSTYGPFGIQRLGSLVYVTFAQHGMDIDEADGPGLGFVDAFSLDGTLVQRISTGSEVNAPWGLAIAPPQLADLGGALLVGNFGDGRIHAYDPDRGELLGEVVDRDDHAIIIDGLWGLAAGTDRDSDTVYFAAGPSDEAHGLFGKLTGAN